MAIMTGENEHQVDLFVGQKVVYGSVPSRIGKVVLAVRALLAPDGGLLLALQKGKDLKTRVVDNVRQMVDSCGVTVADDSYFDRCHVG